MEKNAQMKRPPAKKGVVRRILKTVFRFYPVRMPIVIICIIFSAAVSSIPSVFMQKIIGVIETSWSSGDWSSAAEQILSTVAILAGLYVLSLISAVIFNQIMATITQGTLMKLREKMFNRQN